MTDGNTYEINKYLNEREDWDALQEVTAELEQAEARIEELEGKLSKSEALLAKAVEALQYMVNHASQLETHDGIYWEATEIARTTLAELSSVSCANLKGQDDE